ncbi:MAG: hypothetical protein AABX23_02165 [Nanoarchaeota archaeon]
MINNENIEEVKRLLKNKKENIIVAKEDEFNRKILEHGNFKIILSIEKGNRKNNIRQTNSGLNHILAKIASKNKIAMGIDLNEIKYLEPKQKAERLSKIIQNIKICRKSNTKIAIKTQSLEKARDLVIGLGASTSQSKEAIVF